MAVSSSRPRTAVSSRDAMADVVAAIHEPIGRLFVRDGDVAADVPVGRQVREEIGERLGRSIDEFVGARYAHLREPIPVNHRRARVRNRMTHHAGAARGTVHDAVFRAFMIGVWACFAGIESGILA